MGAWSGRPPHTHTGGGAERAAGGGSPAGGAVAEGVPQPAGAVRGPEPGERGKTTLPPPPPTSRTPHTPPYIPSGFLSLFQRLLEERDALREANEELRCAQVQQSCLQQAGEWGSQRGGQGGHSSYKGRSPHKGPGPHKGHCDLPSVCHSGQRCLHGGSDSDARDPPPGVSCCVCVCVPPTQIKAVFLPFRCTAGWECGPSGKPGGRNPPR